MKAIRIHEYGNASVLRFEEAPLPQHGAEDLLIRVVASSINPVDWKVREGYLKGFIPHALPLILGWDVSGVVEAVGAQVSGFKVGDAVFSRPDISRDGSFAEYIAVRASEVAFKPATVSHIEAAALPLAGITAWESLVKVGQIAAGQRVLVHAGAGGVGSLAIQVAKARGAWVASTCSAANRALVESLGADLVIDYRSTAFQTVLRDLDLVFDTVGGQVQEDSWATLKPGGLLVSITDRPSEERAAAAKARAAFVFIQPDAAVLGELAALVDTGALRPVIGAEFALKDLAKAHALSETGRARGKIVIYVGQP